ncbi:hypothetical protein ACMGOD_004303 [Klebsiella oxytoca]
MKFQIFNSLSSALIHTLAKQELQVLNWLTLLRLEYGQQWSQNDGVVFNGTFPVPVCFVLFWGPGGIVI